MPTAAPKAPKSSPASANVRGSPARAPKADPLSTERIWRVIVRSVLSPKSSPFGPSSSYSVSWSTRSMNSLYFSTTVITEADAAVVSCVIETSRKSALTFVNSSVTPGWALVIVLLLE